MSNFQNLLITQTERQLFLLQDQARFYPDWFKSEEKLINRIVVSESFKGTKVSDFWEGAVFLITGTNLEIKGKWNPFTTHLGPSGLFLSNRIVRYKEPITLKSLAVIIKLCVKLSYNSEIWIVTRGLGVKDENSVIVKLSKESEVAGIFIVFGSPIGDQNEFVFFKRQQVPEENFDPNEEFTDLVLEVLDNGDDRVYVSVRLCVKHSTVFQTYCDKFIPSFVESRVMLVGTGRNVIVEKIEMQQRERLNYGLIEKTRKRESCCEIC